MWEKIKDTFGLPIIMIGGFFYVLFMIFRFFFISPFVNWFENIRDAEDKEKGRAILRGIAIILGIVALIAIGVYNNYGSSYDYERDHYDEYRNEPGW